MSLDDAADAGPVDMSMQSRASFATLLREPNMRRLWIAQGFSGAGESLATVAMPLLVYQLTESARLVGFIALVLILPRVLLAPITGLLADRLDRRRLMIGSDVWRLVFAALVPFATEMWQLALLAIGLAMGNATARPAELATVPSVAGRHRLVAALSLVQVTTAVIRIVGPAVGAAIISALGAGPVFWVQALCYVGSILALRLLVVPALMRPVNPDAVEGRSVLETAKAEMWSGIRAVKAIPIVRGVTATESLWALVPGAMIVAGVVYTQETLDLGDRAEAAFALLTTSMAAGAVFGALVASRVERRIGRPMLLAIGYTGPFFMVTGFFSPAMPIMYAAWFGLGFADAWAVISFQSYLAEVVPEHLRGRVFAAWGAIVALAGAIAYYAMGFVTAWVGAPAAFGLVGMTVGLGGPFLLWITGALRSVRTHAVPAD